MYTQFFGLQVKPFNLTPNPQFLYLSKTHREVYAHLLYGVQNRVGFIEVTGEVGTGKTTILRTFLGELNPEKYRVALIFNPRLTAIELLRSINREFGLPGQEETLSQLVDDLNRFLLEENHAGRIPVLVIDEAQNLSGDVLEQIRLLSNLETETEKLIQIVLAGQPELTQVLSRPELRQLNQRVAVRYHIAPLDPRDCREYICHRLKVAGRPDGELFSPAATRRVHRLTGGVPRLINLLCDRALLIGYADGIGRLMPREVSQASRELAQLPSGRRQNHLWWLTAVALGCAGAVGWFLKDGLAGIFS